jgi:hypothetical protein
VARPWDDALIRHSTGLTGSSECRSFPRGAGPPSRIALSKTATIAGLEDLASRRPERWRQAAHPRSVPSQAPEHERSRARPGTGTLNAIPGVMRPGLRSQGATAPPNDHVLGERWGSDGSGKDNDSAQCFDFRHRFLRMLSWQNRLTRRSFRSSNERDIFGARVCEASPKAISESWIRFFTPCMGAGCLQNIR